MIDRAGAGRVTAQAALLQWLFFTRGLGTGDRTGRQWRLGWKALAMTSPKTSEMTDFGEDLPSAFLRWAPVIYSLELDQRLN